MMEFVCAHAPDAYWILFIMLMCAGLNIPFSEDIILLTGGALAATCIPDQKWHLYTWLFFGCWISAWEAYWLGRTFGPKLYNVRWFKRILTPERVSRLHHYYERFGIWTFIVGRFIPGGVRNGLFMTSGLGQMPFLKFIARDGIACLISSYTLFSIGYAFASHYASIADAIRTYNWVALLIMVGLVTIVFFWRWRQKANNPVL